MVAPRGARRASNALRIPMVTDVATERETKCIDGIGNQSSTSNWTYLNSSFKSALLQPLQNGTNLRKKRRQHSSSRWMKEKYRWQHLEQKRNISDNTILRLQEKAMPRLHLTDWWRDQPEQLRYGFLSSSDNKSSYINNLWHRGRPVNTREWTGWTGSNQTKLRHYSRSGSWNLCKFVWLPILFSRDHLKRIDVFICRSKIVQRQQTLIVLNNSIGIIKCCKRRQVKSGSRSMTCIDGNLRTTMTTFKQRRLRGNVESTRSISVKAEVNVSRWCRWRVDFERQNESLVKLA